MTSKTYLKNKVLKHELAQAFKSSWPILMVMFTIFIIGVPGSIYIKLSSYSNGKPIKEVLKYRMFYPSIDLLLVIGIVILSVFIGYSLFKYLFRKKSMNIYFSLGISRSKVYWSRYIVGFAGIIISVAVPFVISFFINLNMFGYSNELMKALICYTSGFIVIGLFSYTVTIAVCSMVGTKFEGIVFSLITIAFPTIIFYCLDLISKTFLFGNSFNTAIGYNYSTAIESIFMKTASYNPILFVTKYQYSYHLAELGAGKSLPHVNFLPVIIFGIICIAFAVCGNILFKNYKAERSEVTGTNKIMNFLIAFTLGIFVFTLVSKLLYENTFMRNFIVILLSLLVFIVIYTAIEFYFKRKFSMVLKNFKVVLIHIAILLFILLPFITGGFGYSSYIPDIEEIESASVSYMGNPNYIIPTGTFSRGSMGPNSFSHMLNIDTKSDLDIVIGLHKEVINKGKSKATGPYNENMTQTSIAGAGITFKYTLKNGKEIYRNYDSLDFKTIESFLILDSTDAMKKDLQKALTESREINNNEIYVSNSYLSKTKKLELDDKSNKELIEALYNDITKQSIEDCYFGSDKVMGIILINNSMWDIEDFPNDFYMCGKYYITNKFTDTINFLKANSLYGIFDSEPEIEKLYITKSSDYMFPGYSWVPFNRYIDTMAVIQNEAESFNPNYILIDSSKTSELLPLIKPSYYITRGGYIVQMIIKNEENKDKGKYISVYQFLPYQSAPDYIKKLFE